MQAEEDDVNSDNSDEDNDDDEDDDDSKYKEKEHDNNSQSDSGDINAQEIYETCYESNLIFSGYLVLSQRKFREAS